MHEKWKKQMILIKFRQSYNKSSLFPIAISLDVIQSISLLRISGNYHLFVPPDNHRNGGGVEHHDPKEPKQIGVVVVPVEHCDCWININVGSDESRKLIQVASFTFALCCRWHFLFACPKVILNYVYIFIKIIIVV